ncbi:hypothetical protein [Selenomonas ruminantium]|uniref:Uncharacterized protein n=1 Tax=Selenomonas ruminantium TaxID=971 RepID=A0A1I0YK56_SELRU|nr:hypothetical protein [Selenomonas ruminantium]SFB13714.1 hypothetical protein SAMN05216587_11513 [Selenomonas ruminantium]
MLDFVFITKENNTQSFPLTEDEYREFILMGIEKAGKYQNKKVCVEGDDYDVEVMELNEENRENVLNLLNKYIWDLLSKVYKKIDGQSVRTSLVDFDVLRKFKDFKIQIENENNKWLSINP